MSLQAAVVSTIIRFFATDTVRINLYKDDVWFEDGDELQMKMEEMKGWGQRRSEWWVTD